jgi:CelD/BcsL family acetyltransferase involved in cellulose biosynthesis
MQVRLVTDSAAFCALQPAWAHLHAQCAPADVFLSHEWFDAAWQWKGAQASLYLMCCEHEGELVGALPLVIRRREGALPRRALEFLSVPDTQRCDVIALAAARDAVVDALANELVRNASDWDVARLGYLASDSITLAALAPALARERLTCDARTIATNPWIALDSQWPTYYATRSRRLKKAVNLAANRLSKAGRVEIEWIAPGSGRFDDVERALDAIIRISSRSWKTRTGNSLDNPGPQAFIRRVSRLAHERGWLSIWTLSLDGTPIAMEFQLICNGNVHALRSDFDASMEELSPGSHLSRHLIERLFECGFTRYYMGPGDNAYKYRWAEGGDRVHSLAAYGRSLRSRSLAAWELALKPAARRVRDAFRPRPPTPLSPETATEK